MEDIFTIKVKTKPDTANLYPSERRYSASTVAGLAWVHIALAGTSFILACLAIVRPTGGGIVSHLTEKDAITTVDYVEFVENITAESVESHGELKVNYTDSLSHTADEYSSILILSPSMLTVAALSAGVASIMASSHWYVDRNITWLFLMSILSTAASLVSFVMVVTWIASMDSAILSRFYMEKEPFNFIVVPKSNIVKRNNTHLIVDNAPPEWEVREHLITKRVLSINIMIACFLELIWSMLSLKISYKGMRNQYSDAVDKRVGNCVNIVTTVKGNKKLNAVPQPDLIQNYPTGKIKRVLDQKNYKEKHAKPAEESNSEYRERMMDFINRCASFDSQSNLDTATSDRSDALSVIPEVRVDLEKSGKASRVSTISWGDRSDRTVYNQNNLDLGKLITKTIQRNESTDKKKESCQSAATDVAEAETSENSRGS